MARSRNIKPGFFANEALAELPFEYRLLFIGLWTLADREGRIEDRPKRIKMTLFPADNVDCEEGIAALTKAGFLQRYTVEGTSVIWIVAWAKHQNPHHREQPSDLPAPPNPEQGPTLVGAKPDLGTAKPQASPSLAVLIPSSLIPDSPIRTIPPTSADGFEDFWELWPKSERKGSRPKCREVWLSRRLSQVAPEILAHVAAMKKSDQWADHRYIPAPLVYLNQSRWEGAALPTPEDERLPI